MKNLIKKLSLPVMLQLVVALICTIAIPVFAWFAYQDKIEAMTKIKEPPSLNLASGGDDPALYIILENIDVTKAGWTEFVVFSVEAGKYSAYDLQLSHTTNIPFTYKLYRIQQDDENGTIEYTDHSTIDPETGLIVNTTIKYNIMTSSTSGTIVTNGMVNLTDINPAPDPSSQINRKIGNEDVLGERKNYETTDDINKYVKPLYSIARKIPQLSGNVDGSDDRDYFAIKITWQTTTNLSEEDDNYWDYAFNNKETDIIYISAKENSID